MGESVPVLRGVVGRLKSTIGYWALRLHAAASAAPGYCQRMVLKKLPRNAAMDGVDLYRRIDVPTDGSGLSDPARIEAFVKDCTPT